MLSSDHPEGTLGHLAAAFWFAVQFLLLYPVVLLFSLPFLELMGRGLTGKVPENSLAHGEILLFAGLGLGFGLLAGIYLRIWGLTSCFWAARHLWIPPVAFLTFISLASLVVWGKLPHSEGWYYSRNNGGMEVFMITLPTVLYITYSVGVGITWRWSRLRRFRPPDEA